MKKYNDFNRRMSFFAAFLAFSSCGVPLQFPSGSADIAGGATQDSGEESTTAEISSTPWKRFIETGEAGKVVDVSTIRAEVAGNTVVIGTTTAGLDGHTLTGTQDVFFRKFSPNGTLKFTRQIGMAGASWSAGKIYTDISQNIYISVGTMNKDFHGNSITTGKPFIQKYDKNGTLQWTKSFSNGTGTDGFISLAGLVVDNSGNVYAAGNAAGGLEGTAVTGTTDGWLVKLNSSGELQWIRTWGAATKMVSTYHLSITQAGDLLVPGQTTVDLNSSGHSSQSPYLLQYDTNGNRKFTVHLTSSTSSNNAATMGRVVEASDGSIYGCGISSTPDFEGQALIGTGDVVYYKFTSTGTLVWMRRYGLAGYNVYNAPECLSIGKGNRLFTIGMTNGGYQSHTLTGIQDVYISELSPTDGNLLATYQYGISNGTLSRYSIDADRSGNLYVAFSYDRSFMGHTLVGSKAVLVGRISPDSPLTTLETLPEN